jgi:hypothetical protein
MIPAHDRELVMAALADAGLSVTVGRDMEYRGALPPPQFFIDVALTGATLEATKYAIRLALKGARAAARAGVRATAVLQTNRNKSVAVANYDRLRDDALMESLPVDELVDEGGYFIAQENGWENADRREGRS